MSAEYASFTAGVPERLPIDGASPARMPWICPDAGAHGVSCDCCDVCCVVSDFPPMSNFLSFLVIARRPKADEAISAASHAQVKRDCFASLAMTPTGM